MLFSSGRKILVPTQDGGVRIDAKLGRGLPAGDVDAIVGPSTDAAWVRTLDEHGMDRGLTSYAVARWAGGKWAAVSNRELGERQVDAWIDGFAPYKDNGALLARGAMKASDDAAPDARFVRLGGVKSARQAIKPPAPYEVRSFAAFSSGDVLALLGADERPPAIWRWAQGGESSMSVLPPPCGCPSPSGVCSAPLPFDTSGAWPWIATAVDAVVIAPFAATSEGGKVPFVYEWDGHTWSSDPAPFGQQSEDDGAGNVERVSRANDGSVWFSRGRRVWRRHSAHGKWQEVPLASAFTAKASGNRGGEREEKFVDTLVATSYEEAWVGTSSSWTARGRHDEEHLLLHTQGGGAPLKLHFDDSRRAAAFAAGE